MANTWTMMERPNCKEECKTGIREIVRIDTHRKRDGNHVERGKSSAAAGKNKEEDARELSHRP